MARTQRPGVPWPRAARPWGTAALGAPRRARKRLRLLGLPGPSVGDWEKLVTLAPTPASFRSRRGREMGREETRHRDRREEARGAWGEGAHGELKALSRWTELQGLRGRSAPARTGQKLASGTSYRGKETQE